MSALDDKIDDLYRQPLSDFTAARNALARTLSGDDAKRVKALAKPTVVPWAVNQLYWHARSAYDRVMKSGAHLRTAQIAALEGKRTDVRAASDAHRKAIADAVAQADRLAAATGSKPSPDALARTFEALSLSPDRPEAPGRLTEALQPAGFEALAGVTPAKSAAHHGTRHEEPRHPSPEPRGQTATQRRAAEAAERRAADEARAAAAAARKRQAELEKADAAVARADASEKLARAAWEHAHDALLEARRKRDEIKRSTG